MCRDFPLPSMLAGRMPSGKFAARLSVRFFVYNQFLA